jgi:hypothetical protein
MQTNGGLFGKNSTWQNRGLPSRFAVLSCAQNRLIGYSGFFHQEANGTSEIEIGYRLHPNYWNKGLATEAAQAVRAHAFVACHFINSSGDRGVAPGGRKNPALVFAISRERWVTNCAA